MKYLVAIIKMRKLFTKNALIGFLILANFSLVANLYVRAVDRGQNLGEVFLNGVEFQDFIGFADWGESILFNIFVKQIGDTYSSVPDAFENVLIFFTKTISNPSNMEIAFWDKTNNKPVLVLNEGAVARASTFNRSLQVGKALGASPFDEDYTVCEGFLDIDCATSVTGADLGVEDDIEAKGSIYSQGGMMAGHMETDPCEDYPEGMFFYNPEDGYMCFCDDTDAAKTMYNNSNCY